MSTTKQSGIDQTAIYHELSPRLVWTVRFVNIITLLMVVLAVIFCFVQGHKNGSYYLLVANLIISGLVCLVVNWWYRSGDLGSEKFWFVLLVGVVILLQCISTDIFVFKEESQGPAITTPRTTTPHHNMSTKLYPWTSMVPAHTSRIP